MEGKLTVLEATVAELGASNVRLKEKLNRKRKRSRAGSLFPQFVAKHRRRSAPQIPQNIDLPEHDQHASPNSKRRKINQTIDGCLLGSKSLILSQYRAQHHYSRRSDFNNLVGPDHDSSHHHSPDHNYSHQPFPDHNSPHQHANDHHSPDHNSSHQHSPDQNSPHHRSPNHHSPNHHSPDPNSPHNRSPNNHSPNHHSPTNQSPQLSKPQTS
ncbi:unnamed protein product [Brassica oleracea var. botrytis]